jgi:hypothetical protein
MHGTIEHKLRLPGRAAKDGRPMVTGRSER